MPGIIIFCMSYVLSQFYRSFLAVLSPTLISDLSMGPSELAVASAAYFIAFALFQFPVGYFLDTYGPRRTAGYIFLLFGGSGAGLFAFATSGWMVITAMAFLGVGCSPVLMAPLYIFARNYSPRKFAFYLSTFVAIGTLGNIAGTEPLAAALNAFGWQNVGIFLFLLTVIVAIIILLIVVDPVKTDAQTRKGSTLDLLKIRELWLIFPIILTGYIAGGGIRGLWIGPYLADIHAMNSLEIGRASLFMAIALVAGTFAYGPIDRLLNSRKWVIAPGYLVVILCCLYMAMVIPESALVSTIVFVLIGFFGASYAVQMAHGKSFVPQHLMGRGATLLNFCSIGGAGFFQFLSGWVVEGNTIPGSPEHSYQALFMFYVMIMGVSLVIYLFSRDAAPSD